MVYFLALATGLWFLGRHLNAPPRARWMMIGLLYLAVLGVLVAVREGHPLQRALGGTLAEWLVLGLLGLAVFGYRGVLGALKRRARVVDPSDPAPSGTAGTFRPAELERYARHIVLREIGGPGQKRLKGARVLVVGAGGLGSPALLYLAAAGVGTIGVIDDDEVENANLQRQVIHADGRIGMPKVFSAEIGMLAVNPFVAVRPYNRRLADAIAGDLVSEFDLVLDGTDNFETRYLVNRACAAKGVPLIAAALAQWEGQISLYDPARGVPCYECVFPQAPAPGLAPSCAEAGVLGPLPGVVGSMMAVEAIKALTGAGETLAGRMLIYDALYGETRLIGLKRRAECPVCGTAA